VCGSSARTDLYGGRSAMTVPTVTVTSGLGSRYPATQPAIVMGGSRDHRDARKSQTQGLEEDPYDPGCNGTPVWHLVSPSSIMRPPMEALCAF
jgi:hypothetical protein